MPTLQQFSDRISLHNRERNYNGTRAEFERHYGKRLPDLPEGIEHRLYEPGKCHALSANCNVLDGGPMPWAEGDAALAVIDNLIAKQHDEAEATVAAAREKVEEQIRAENEKRAKEQEEMLAQLKVASEQHRAQAEQAQRQADEQIATLGARRNAALDKLAAVLQRAGASGAEVQEIIDGIWPKPENKQ